MALDHFAFLYFCIFVFLYFSNIQFTISTPALLLIILANTFIDLSAKETYEDVLVANGWAVVCPVSFQAHPTISTINIPSYL